MAGPRKPGGVAFYCDGVNTTEVHSSKCRHCGHHTEFPSMRVMMDYIDFCRSCMQPICLACVGKPCIPEMKRIEEAERAYQNKVMTRKMYGSI